ncbi:MAG: TatA/E family twin arginine-targeting protein translocase [Gloeobacterales cyanobacterium]
MEIFGIGPLELMVIGLVAMLVFGPKKLPELGKTLGQASRSFKVAAQEFQREINREMEKESSPPKATAPPTKELDA